MEEKRSLTNFFQSRGLDIDACGREQIHLFDAMQAGAELIVCGHTADGWRIEAATATLLECSEVLGQRLLGEFLNIAHPDLFNRIEALEGDVERKSGLWFSSDPVEVAGQAYDAVIHAQDDGPSRRLFIEFVPTVETDTTELRCGIRNVQRAIFDLGQAETIPQAAQQTVELARDLLGYDRIMIYRFLEDWTGEVIAESKEPGLPSFQGMRFPSSDIPPQARELYRILPYRLVLRSDDARNPLVRDSAADAAPYDLSQVLCRAVSTYHTKYLRNMDIGASLSIGLEKNGKLWGIMACHHRSQRTCAYDMVSFAQEMTRAFMASESRLQELEKIRKVQEMRRIEARVAQNIRGSGSVMSALTTLAPTLMELIPSTGAAIVYGDTIATHGASPPDDFIKLLVAWTQRHQTDSCFATTNLQSHWPESAPYKDVACGVMVQPVLLNRVCQIIWFRKPLGEEVLWAGEAESDVRAKKASQSAPLTPRASFEAWKEQNAEFSADWTQAEVSATKEIFTDVLDIVAGQARLLASMNERLSMAESDLRRELEQFAAAASHDMRGPLRVIKMAASMAQDDMADGEFGSTGHLEDIMSASDRLATLTDRMLTYTRLSQVDATSEVVDVAAILQKLSPAYPRGVDGNAVLLEVDELPQVVGDPYLIELILDNLIGNAIKYHPGGRPVRIHVDAEAWGAECRIRVTDNGDGIESEHANTIFEPFKRLHRSDEVDGAGLGLAMCRRTADLLNADIYLDRDYRDGARFVIQLRKVQSRRRSRDLLASMNLK